jgi:hypothetical protein
MDKAGPRGGKFAVCAPMHKAALLIGVVTIYNLSNIDTHMLIAGRQPAAGVATACQPRDSDASSSPLLAPRQGWSAVG